MERLVQYLDDLEDLFYVLPLIWEKIRRLASLTLFLLSSVALQALCIYLALEFPPMAVALAALLIVTALYRSVVYYGPRPA